jgi:hypothetical protein
MKVAGRHRRRSFGRERRETIGGRQLRLRIGQASPCAPSCSHEYAHAGRLSAEDARPEACFAGFDPFVLEGTGRPVGCPLMQIRFGHRADSHIPKRTPKSESVAIALSSIRNPIVCGLTMLSLLD